ncbi:hypothetical protein PS627_04239 [Pseudomonas fluorescens]|uniref:hypothetical protein n=1 Tax=Pseudomonas fluorescens TaxID=294 RepID=UPI0012554D51|nr:hypothetical protein [Pseudomonas fluorescens]CAG8871003.1 hypothetical protein PS627_04239 [Pseudomonas fluorescens]VVP79271.1 hypothetical protein PS910_01793 [Pseudomonas fluorescens]
MLKIVPDPPHHNNHSLEDILVSTSEYLACAMTIAQNTVMLYADPAGQTMTLTTMHEIDRAHALVEMALSKVQARH